MHLVCHQLCRLRAVATLVALFSLCSSARAADRFEFTRMLAHWDGYADPGYLPFIEAAQPEVVQVGFYGAHFYSLAHTKEGAGYPAHFPVVGLKECGSWFERLNGELHRRGAKVVGHFNVKFIVGDPDSPQGPRGFFKFYREMWDERELGPRPVADPLDLLEKNADGTPIGQSNYGIGGMREYWGCLNNPAWRSMLKAWTKVAVKRGVDGLIANYFYRHNCTCEHCQREFKNYLRERVSKEKLWVTLGISDLDQHHFTEITAWHEPRQSTPLKREMLRFSQIANKRAFDEVLNEYGRSLKPDLIVAQWDHLGDFDQIRGDERCMLPGDLWGKGEDYLWYSTGGTACFTDLKNGFLGEGTLHARYIRGAFDDKPFTLGKYEQTRTRVTIAELAANGGAPMGFYARFTDPQARAEIVRYYQFLKKYEKLYRANRSHAEVLLVYPRRSVHKGDVSALERFKESGRSLLKSHVLFDVVPDDLLTSLDRVTAQRYRHVIKQYSSDRAIDPRTISLFNAPHTLRVSASIPAAGSEIDLHFVNYNRHEPAEPRSPGSGIAEERPIPARDVVIDFALPVGTRVTRVEMITPEAPNSVVLEHKIEHRTENVRVHAKVPEFLVYAVVRIRDMETSRRNK